MMGRRVVERRRVVKKWWAPSTNAAQLGFSPARRTLAGAARARSESESRRDPETRSTRKGRRRVARHAPDGDVDRRGSPGGGDTFRRTANRATAPARERVRSSVGRARASYFQVADFVFVSSLPFECRKADRAASSWQTTSPSSQDQARELLRANAAL